jgi:hypothetical protein
MGDHPCQHQAGRTSVDFRVMTQGGFGVFLSSLDELQTYIEL